MRLSLLNSTPRATITRPLTRWSLVSEGGPRVICARLDPLLRLQVKVGPTLCLASWDPSLLKRIGGPCIREEPGSLCASGVFAPSVTLWSQGLRSSLRPADIRRPVSSLQDSKNWGTARISRARLRVYAVFTVGVAIVGFGTIATPQLERETGSCAILVSEE